MPLKIRPATPEDAPALTDILHRARAAGCPEDKVTAFQEHVTISAATIATIQISVAERGGRPVAFSGLSEQNEETLLLDFLFVEPEAQGQGLGDLLLRRAEDLARWKGLTRLILEAGAGVSRFYGKRGFRTLVKRNSETPAGEDVHLMEKGLTPVVHAVKSLNVSLSPAPWAFEVTHADAIDRHFAEALAHNPRLWNGRTYKLTQVQFEDGIFTGTCTECSFAAFLAWRDWGAPDASTFNMFGSAFVRSADGALLYGVMAEHTASAGLIYPPGGNLDPSDLQPDGRIDILGSIYRELEEETGLKPHALRPGPLLAAFDGPRISIGQVLEADRPAADMREDMMRFSDASEEQELADIRIIRSRADLGDPAIVPYARAVADHLLP